MLFSVIVPVYNVENYLPECIDSILAQTFACFELILVDDGSTDSSGLICDRYAQLDERIKVIHKQNGGQSDARNTGLASATGDYVIFIDSDDYVLDKAFLLNIYDKASQGFDIIIYKFAKYFESEKRLAPCTFSYSAAEEKTEAGDILLTLVRNDAYYGSPWSKAICRRLLVDNHITFEKGLLGEDMEWYFHVVLAAGSFAVIDLPFIAYRQRAGSTTSSIGLKNLSDCVYIVEKWGGRVADAELCPTMRLALQGALAKYYANLLILYARIKDGRKRSYYARMRTMRGLLNFSMSARPAAMKLANRLVGFGGTVALINILEKIRR